MGLSSWQKHMSEQRSEEELMGFANDISANLNFHQTKFDLDQTLPYEFVPEPWFPLYFLVVGLAHFVWFLVQILLGDPMPIIGAFTF